MKSDSRIAPPRTWSEVKAAVEAAGVKNDDFVFALDLGPYVCKIVVDRDDQGVEIADDASEIMG
jgi:hypothetical protein